MKTKNRDLSVGDVVIHDPDEYPQITTVVVHVGGTCDSHPGNTFAIVRDFDAATNSDLGSESDWCSPAYGAFWTVTGSRPDLFRKYLADNEEEN